jgi:hypothetical protein
MLLDIEREKLHSSVRPEVEESLANDIYISMKQLIWLYNYIKRNIKSMKIKSLFLNMEEECKTDLKLIENKFSPNPDKTNLIKTRKLNNFISCIKFAISNEARLVQKLILLNQCQFTMDMCKKHLDFIQRLSNF